ncbi:MFS transporter [Paenibacillus sp. FSL R7-0273]|uniref:MFS transporter n=1 Tax=Paenibacillus sp. FSL R7-0273 TaxID=1536772 RepID=UPI0004F6C047|nr:MFS transporter [Paenibacillus sp. FSL R7-0273]AIQ49794.1 MFS transporter [Paenibacillus sp. FSL R7-0273]OMF92375.1 MFS transporter [Paenibacillus sp. FSL R7-0273]
MKFLQDYPREIKVFLIASLVNATGSALMWPLVTMYVFEELGRSMQDAGIVIAIQSFGGIAGQLLGGSLYHKLGVKRLIVGALAMNAMALFALPVSSSNWYLFMVVMGLVGLFNSMAQPAIQAFVGFRFAERRGELFNIIYVANNIGVALGTILSGFLADISYMLSFVMNGLTSAIFAVFFLVYLRKITSHPVQEVPHKARTREQSGWKLAGNTRLYLYLSLGTMFLLVGNSVWNTGVSPFIISEGWSKSLYSFLWTLNGILIFAAQPVISLIKRWFAGTSNAQMTASAVFYLSGYGVILLMPSYPGLVLAMVLATLGEMLISPATPAFIADTAGRNAPFYMGLSGGIGAAGRVIGPALMGGLFDRGGLAPTGWLACGMAVLAVGFFVIHAYVNRPARNLEQNAV